LDELRAEPQSIPAGLFARHGLALLLGTIGAIVATACVCHEVNDALENSAAPAWAKNNAVNYLNNILLGFVGGFVGVLLAKKVCDATDTLASCVAWGAKKATPKEKSPLLVDSSQDWEATPTNPTRRISCNMI
jgi:uncharacterized membrane protein YeaQ/YmgE (transglycosylase-associated protein family)